MRGKIVLLLISVLQVTFSLQCNIPHPDDSRCYLSPLPPLCPSTGSLSAASASVGIADILSRRRINVEDLVRKHEEIRGLESLPTRESREAYLLGASSGEIGTILPHRISGEVGLRRSRSNAGSFGSVISVFPSKGQHQDPLISSPYGRIAKLSLVRTPGVVGLTRAKDELFPLPQPVNPEPFPHPGPVNPEPFLLPGPVNPEPFPYPGPVNPEPFPLPGPVNPEPFPLPGPVNPEPFPLPGPVNPEPFPLPGPGIPNIPPPELTCLRHKLVSVPVQVIEECITNVPVIKKTIRHQQETVTRHIPIFEKTVTQQHEKIVRQVPVARKTIRNVIETRIRHVPVIKSRSRTIVEPYTVHIPITERISRPVEESITRTVPITTTRVRPVVIERTRFVRVVGRKRRPIVDTSIHHIPVRRNYLRNVIEHRAQPVLGPCRPCYDEVQQATDLSPHSVSLGRIPTTSGTDGVKDISYGRDATDFVQSNINLDHSNLRVSESSCYPPAHTNAETSVPGGCYSPPPEC